MVKRRQRTRHNRASRSLLAEEVRDQTSDLVPIPRVRMNPIQEPPKRRRELARLRIRRAGHPRFPDSARDIISRNDTPGSQVLRRSEARKVT